MSLRWEKKASELLDQKVKVIVIQTRGELPEYSSKYIEYTQEEDGNITRLTIVNKVSYWYQVKESLGLHFGMRYMIMRLIGIQLLVIGFTYLNFVQTNTNESMIIGLLACILVVVVYCVIGYQLFEAGRAGVKLVCAEINKAKMRKAQTDRGKII